MSGWKAAGGNGVATNTDETAEGPWRARLYEVLGRSLAAGFLGSPVIEEHVDHACGFAAAVLSARPSVPEKMADLGSGGGLPGLVLAELWRDTYVVLIEANARRARFLKDEAHTLGQDRVTVVPERAETVGRDEQYRQTFEVVTSRSFGPPGVTAECAAPLLALGGLLVVSDPPTVQDAERWPQEQLQILGLAPLRSFRYEDRYNFACLEKVSDSPARYPRRVGVPMKRPLF